MHSFFPNTLIAAPKAVPQTVFPLQLNKKNSSGNSKEITKTWLVPMTLHKAHQWDHLLQQAVGALQTKQGHFKLINDNILHYVFPSEDFKEHHQCRIK